MNSKYMGISGGIELRITDQLDQWKMLSTKQLQVLINPDIKLDVYQTHVKSLLDKRLIEDADVSSRARYVRLTSKGLTDLLKVSDETRTNLTVRSEYYTHDLLVNAFHIGELPLYDHNDQLNLTTEQQLRSDPFAPHPFHQSDFRQRRPDGLTWVNRKNKFICFEVELTLKENKRYADTLDFYAKSLIGLVLWLVKSKAQVNRLKRVLGEDSMSARKHNFILLEDFLRDYWNAKIIDGELQGQTILQVHPVMNKKISRMPLPESLHTHFIEPLRFALVSGKDLNRGRWEGDGL